MKLLLDERISPAVADALRGRGYDVIAVAEREELRGMQDIDILVTAAAERRVTVTADIRDFVALGARRLPDRRWHSGIVLAPRRALPRFGAAHGLLIRALGGLLADHADDDLTGMVVWLQRAPEDRGSS